MLFAKFGERLSPSESRREEVVQANAIEPAPRSLKSSESKLIDYSVAAT
jgi:hypothetical protein